jgi:hypothetical protein
VFKAMILAAVFMGSVGCVAQSEYDKLNTLYIRSREQMADLQSRLEEANARIRALQEELRQQASSGLVPQGPVRQMIASRPRVTDMVTGYDRSAPPGVGVSRLVADELAQAGWPTVFWTEAALPPNDGWRLTGQVVSLDEGSAAARNVIGGGVGNKHVGIDVMLSDPNTAGGSPFLILDSSDRGRMMPGTVAVGAVAGFNPAVIVGKHVVSNSGIADVTQQQRLADEIAGAIAEAVNAHAAGQGR